MFGKPVQVKPLLDKEYFESYFSNVIENTKTYPFYKTFHDKSFLEEVFDVKLTMDYCESNRLGVGKEYFAGERHVFIGSHKKEQNKQFVIYVFSKCKRYRLLGVEFSINIQFGQLNYFHVTGGFVYSLADYEKQMVNFGKTKCLKTSI